MNLQELINSLNLFIGSEQIDKFIDAFHSYDHIILLGNGGSNSICSHAAQDFAKQAGKNTHCFSDPSRLTCYINDFGMEEAYVKFLEHTIPKNQEDDFLVILISSSGNSKNIVNCAKFCVEGEIGFGILTGFSHNNILRSFSDKSLFDIWVDSNDYGVVETTHAAILHTAV